MLLNFTFEIPSVVEISEQSEFSWRTNFGLWSGFEKCRFVRKSDVIGNLVYSLFSSILLCIYRCYIFRIKNLFSCQTNFSRKYFRLRGEKKVFICTFVQFPIEFHAHSWSTSALKVKVNRQYYGYLMWRLERIWFAFSSLSTWRVD